jgi:transcriptional regulator with XRE-family HTH domain
METLPRRLDRLMREAGYNPRSLSLAASLGTTAVRDIVEGRIASPRYATLRALADILGVGVEYLAGNDAGGQADPGRGRSADPGLPPAEVRTVTAGVRDLPVYGAAQGGPEGAMVVSSEAIQWVHRPEPLLTVAAGYGVFVVGESMSPAYEQGDIALVHPSLPPRRGADVILIRHDPDGTRHVLIKRLTGWSDDVWHVRQYNPARDFDLLRAEWHEVQAIVGKYHAR